MIKQKQQQKRIVGQQIQTVLGANQSMQKGTWEELNDDSTGHFFFQGRFYHSSAVRKDITTMLCCK